MQNIWGETGGQMCLLLLEGVKMWMSLCSLTNIMDSHALMEAFRSVNKIQKLEKTASLVSGLKFLGR